MAEDALRELIARPDDPGIMRPLAATLLARLMARRGDARGADEVLLPAIDVASGSDEIQLVGPVATAQVELMWLAGETGPAPTLAAAALALDTTAGGSASRAELCRYLQRLGVPVGTPGNAPGPWAPALEGDWQMAASAWDELGERYERALELVSSGDPPTAVAGREILGQLGAAATLERVG